MDTWDNSGAPRDDHWNNSAPNVDNGWSSLNQGSDNQMGGGDSANQWSERERSPRRQWNQADGENHSDKWNSNDSGGSWKNSDNGGDTWKRRDNGSSWSSSHKSGANWKSDDNNDDKWKRDDKWNKKEWGGGGGWKKDWRSESRPTGDWDCPNCSFQNFARNKKCKKCGTLRPGLAAEEGEQEDEEAKKKDKLVRAIKKYQRLADDNTENWYWFCDVNKFRDKYDPGRKPFEFLEDFVTAMKISTSEEDDDCGKGTKGSKRDGMNADSGKGESGKGGGMLGLPDVSLGNPSGMNLLGGAQDMATLFTGMHQIMSGMSLPGSPLPQIPALPGTPMPQMPIGLQGMLPGMPFPGMPMPPS